VGPNWYHRVALGQPYLPLETGFGKTYLRVNYHRLNGSSSPVLTATSLSYGKAKNSTPPTESKPLI